MLSLPSIEGIDAIQLNKDKRKQKKADYLGMGRKVIFEQKCINQEQANKVQAEIDKYIGDENYPMFYGQRDFNQVIDKLPNKNEIKKRVYSSITKLLESYLRQSDKQIASTRELFSLDNPLGVLIILNEKVKVLSPEIVATRLQQRMRETDGNKHRFSNIDYVIFISETHTIKGSPPIIAVEGAGARNHPSTTTDYIDYIANSWAQFNGASTLQFSDKKELLSEMKEVEPPIPSKLTRSEARKKWYRSNRYMENWADEQVAKAAANHLDSIKPYILKGGPQLPQNQLAELMMKFGDYIEESNIRGLDLRELKKYHNI